jgi:hypothetical protein
MVKKTASFALLVGFGGNFNVGVGSVVGIASSSEPSLSTVTPLSTQPRFSPQSDDEPPINSDDRE